MTTKLELIQAAQNAAAQSLTTKTEAELVEFRKTAFASLSISKKNWQFYADHFNGARQQYLVNAREPIAEDHPLDPPIETKP